MLKFKDHIDKNLKEYLIGINIFLVLFVFFIWRFPEYYIQWYYSYLNGKEQLDAIKDMRSSIFNIGAGILALVGIYLTWRRTKALDKQNTINKENNDNNLLLQQYSKASELLGNESNLSIRLSGIYLFEKILNENEDYNLQIIELLCTYITVRRIIELEKYDNIQFNEIGIDLIRKEYEINLEKDIHAIINVLSRRKNYKNTLDLNNINFIGINFRKINFTNSLLNNLIFDLADISFSSLNDADLSFSYFRKAHLHEVNFNNSELTYVKFHGAFLGKSKFNYANINGAEFNNAHLQNANFENSKIISANFENADLNLTKFNNAIIEGTNFNNSHLFDADFESCNLVNINFENAHLQNVNFMKIKLNMRDKENDESDIIDFIESINKAKNIRGIQLDEEILQTIISDYKNLYEKINK